MKHLKLLLAVLGLLVFANVLAAAKDFDLHQAVLDKNIGMVKRLLSKGLYIDEIGSRKYGYGSPLHLAVREGHLDIAKLLLDRGAQVDVLDPDDYTPLHNAAWNGNLEMAELLLEAGADIEASTYDGDTPLKLAQNNDQAQVAEFIQAKLQPSASNETKFNSQTASDSSVIDITGTYVSEITYQATTAPGIKKHDKIVLLLEQHGNTITGTDSSGKADIRGTRTGDTIKIEFWAPFWSYGADVVWKVNADGTQLDGSWTKGSIYGEWDLTKIESDLAPIPDISGVYISEITGDTHLLGLKNKPYLETKIVQTGNNIEGSLGTSCKIYGDIEGNTIRFEWGKCGLKPTEYGKGKWTIQPGGNEIVGKWLTTGSHPGGSGEWNLTKVAGTSLIAKAADYIVPSGVTVLTEEHLLKQAVGNTFFNERFAEYWEPPTGDQKKGYFRGKHVRGDYGGSWEIKDALICFEFDKGLFDEYSGTCYTISLDGSNATWYETDGSTYYPPNGGRIKLISGNPKNL